MAAQRIVHTTCGVLLLLVLSLDARIARATDSSVHAAAVGKSEVADTAGTVEVPIPATGQQVPAPTPSPTLPQPQAHAPPVAVAVQPAATPKEQAEVVAQTASPDGPSGFRLMTLSTNALLSRISLADQAKRSIDLQYFIFDNDATGRLLALHLLQAADRGVHVRILLDNLNVAKDVQMFRALDVSENIQVRLFNPFSTPNPNALSKLTQFILHFRRLNRRMHNKSFIVDNDVAVIGGRNIGDGYFDANSDNNFRDMDLLAIGPVVPQATKTFEAYWSSDAAHALTAYKAKGDPADDLERLRVDLQKDARELDDSGYAKVVQEDIPHGPSSDRPGNWYWGPAQLVADQPEKIANGKDRLDLRIGPQLKTLMDNAKSEILLISPYFVPGAEDEQRFIADAGRGVAVKLLTNSLESTDELPVHEGYSDHRRKLLEGGVQLYELKPAPGVKMSSTDAGRSSGVSLHAKAFVVDRRYVFIGSMNMDERSKLLNTEMGIVVDSPQLAKAVAEYFETATLPANAYHVVLGARDGSHASEMYWQAKKDGEDVEYDNEPGASLIKRAEILLLKLLPIDGLL
ncbi:MAG: phospholipase D-like domain-containing protein [Lysobacteraceae bacterium]